MIRPSEVDLDEEEIQAAGLIFDEPADEPFGDWDPMPEETSYDADPTGIMGETKAGVWTRLDPDVLLEHEPNLWGVVDRYFSGVRRVSGPDLDRLSSFELDALATLRAATHREESRYLKESVPKKDTEEGAE